MLPDPVSALAIFVNLMITFMHFWMQKYEFAFLHLGVSTFLIYLQIWKYSKSKSEK